MDKSTNKSNNITITNDKGRLTKDEIEEMLEKADQFKEEDEKVKLRIEEKNGLEGYLYHVKNSVSEEQVASKTGR